MPAARKPNPIDTYRTYQQQLSDWDDYLRQESRLPGPRANLELLEAVIQAGDGSRFAHLLALDSSFPGGAPAQHARRVPHRLRRRGPGQARRRRRSRLAVRAAPPRCRRALARRAKPSPSPSSTGATTTCSALVDADAGAGAAAAGSNSAPPSPPSPNRACCALPPVTSIQPPTSSQSSIPSRNPS